MSGCIIMGREFQVQYILLKRSQRNAVTAFCFIVFVIPPVAEVEPRLINQNGEFEAAHCRPNSVI